MPSHIVKWVPFRWAAQLHSLQQGTLNVGNRQQNTKALLASAIVNANGTATWAKWRVGAVTRTSSNSLLIDVKSVPGYVQPVNPSVPAGALALAYNTNLFTVYPTFADVSFTNAATAKLYAALYYQSFPADANNFANQASGPLSLKLGTANAGIFVSTLKQNSTPGALPVIPAAKGFYVEWAATSSTNAMDPFSSLWLLPQEHNYALSDSLASPPAPAGTVGHGYEGWAEIDCDESGFGSYQQSLFSLIDWHGTYSGLPAVASASQTVAAPGVFTTAAQAYTANLMVHLTGAAPGGFTLNTPYFVSATGLTSTTCQLSASYGGASIACSSSAACTLVPSYINVTTNNVNVAPVIDRTVEHIYGVSYDPIAQKVSKWLDGKFVTSFSTSAFDYEINPYHYYMIMGATSHGLNTQFQISVRTFSAWVP